MLEVSSIPMDTPDIHTFPNMKWVLTMCTPGNLSISLNWKNSKITQLFIIENLIVQYYFCVKWIGHLCMFQNIFSHRPPL